jgi:hypothetical protein
MPAGAERVGPTWDGSSGVSMPGAGVGGAGLTLASTVWTDVAELLRRPDGDGGALLLSLQKHHPNSFSRARVRHAILTSGHTEYVRGLCIFVV